MSGLWSGVRGAASPPSQCPMRGQSGRRTTEWCTRACCPRCSSARARGARWLPQGHNPGFHSLAIISLHIYCFPCKHTALSYLAPAFVAGLAYKCAILTLGLQHALCTASAQRLARSDAASSGHCLCLCGATTAWPHSASGLSYAYGISIRQQAVRANALHAAWHPQHRTHSLDICQSYPCMRHNPTLSCFLNRQVTVSQNIAKLPCGHMVHCKTLS